MEIVRSPLLKGDLIALGTKLAALGHHGVKVAQGEEDAFELDLSRAHLQGVLRAASRGREFVFFLSFLSQGLSVSSRLALNS